MNLQRLKQAETDFLIRYPGGFQDSEMESTIKKHKMSKMIDMVQTEFAPDQFGRSDLVIENLIKVVRQSSLISLFEKPKFRDFCNLLSGSEREMLVDGLYERLHGDEQTGFEMWLDLLITGKMAKWTLMTVVPMYFDSTREAFVKPTTVKNMIKELEMENLEYRPQPSWAFYSEFRKQVNSMKKKVDPTLAPSNVAFTGFLMMTL